MRAGSAAAASVMAVVTDQELAVIAALRQRCADLEAALQLAHDDRDHALRELAARERLAAGPVQDDPETIDWTPGQFRPATETATVRAGTPAEG